MAEVTPFESEFATIEESESHEAWFRATVEARLASLKLEISYDEAKAQMQAIIV